MVDASVATRLDLRRTPASYPGPPVTTSVLLLPGCAHRLTMRSARGLGRARVEPCASCAARAGRRVVCLDEELRRRRRAGVGARYTVAAVGSNASADVLRGKLERAGVSPVLPLLTGRLTNVAVGHSAHVSRPGFVPAAPMRADGRRRDVVVGFFDREQLRALDATEPNYVRRLLDGREFPLLLDGGQALAGFHLYDSRWGLLADRGAALPLGDQRDVSAWLARCGIAPWRRHAAAEAARILAADERLRDELAADFRRRSLVTPAGLDGPDFADVTYGAANDPHAHVGTVTP